VVEPDLLGGPVLREEICAAITDSRGRIRRAVARHLNLDGARRAAAHLLALADPQAEQGSESAVAPPVLLRSSNRHCVQEPVDVAV
jgi:hypothetical protein